NRAITPARPNMEKYCCIQSDAHQSVASLEHAAAVRNSRNDNAARIVDRQRRCTQRAGAVRATYGCHRAHPCDSDPGFSHRISAATESAFEPTSGPLVALWRRCKQEGRIPPEDEIDAAREFVGFRHVAFDEQQHTVKYAVKGVELNLGSIGKGYALDRAGDV